MCVFSGWPEAAAWQREEAEYGQQHPEGQQGEDVQEGVRTQEEAKGHELEELDRRNLQVKRRPSGGKILEPLQTHSLQARGPWNKTTQWGTTKKHYMEKSFFTLKKASLLLCFSGWRYHSKGKAKSRKTKNHDIIGLANAIAQQTRTCTVPRIQRLIACHPKKKSMQSSGRLLTPPSNRRNAKALL